MRYLGGKWRIARRIVSAIIADVGHRPRHALELCSGAGGLTRLLAEACDRVTAVETHVGLVKLLRDVQGGYVPPVTVTREEHDASIDPSDPLHAFRRFACSHGGAWDGYYLPDEPPREYATPILPTRARAATRVSRRRHPARGGVGCLSWPRTRVC